MAAMQMPSQYQEWAPGAGLSWVENKFGEDSHRNKVINLNETVIAFK